ncbi:YIP1 family protein [Ammonifex thiophilus]|uniref:YIP1 family protein n=1 Tax=Ammonifex thiophilus TaxID=444093 RepID=A0A3D8P5X0_9THEO|nr:YIP1 family protein [Ammonifex thiophilus]RDV84716.1 YIP1 family protein [Ammonifex thiophilus]
MAQDPQIVEREKRSGGCRFLRAFYAPRQLFEELADKPSFLAMALALTAINLVLVVVALPKLQALTLHMFEQNPPPVPPEELERVRALLPKQVAIGGVASGVLFPWVIWLLVALALKIYAAFSTKEAPYRTLFAVAVFGYLPVFLGSIIAYVLILALPVQSLPHVTLSLAAFLPQQKTLLYNFLAQCNPFTWWSLVLWGLGGAVAMRTKPSGPVLYMFGLWLLVALLLAALGTLSPGAA